MAKISNERILQVIHDLRVEYVDEGKTNFATKKELCEVILFLYDEAEKTVFAHEMTEIKLKGMIAALSE